MKVALFSSQDKFDRLKSYFDRQKFPVNIFHTENIGLFYQTLFREKQSSFSLVLAEYDFNFPSSRALLDSVKLHFSGVDCAVLSDEVVEGDEGFSTFDLSEFGLRRLGEYLESGKVKRFKKSQGWRLSSGANESVEWLLKKYETIINGAGEAIVWVSENGNITFLNRFACSLFGKHEVDLLGKPLSDFALNSPLNKGANADSFTGKGCDSRRVGRGAISKPDGSFAYVEYTQTFVGNTDDETVSIMVIEEIGDRVKFEAKLRSLANKDMLTGLYNRYYLQRTLQHELNDRRKEEQPFVIALVDLDNFKEVNDQYGHAAGDKLLISIAKKLKENVRRCDLVARLGGDEFVVLFRDSSEHNARAVAENILSRIAEPLDIGGKHIHISASVGLCSSASIGATFDQLLENLDEAMYQVKKKGKNGIRIFRENEIARKKFSDP